jgi:hypothetical protein
MRKLLALILVLGLASMASAIPTVGGIELSVNGLAAPDVWPDDLIPSDELTLDIHVLDGTVLAGFVLAVQVSGPGSLLPGNVIFAETPPTYRYVDIPGIFTGWTTGDRAWGSGAVAVAIADPQMLRFSAGNLDFNTVGEYTLMDNLVFHCEGEGDVLVELVALDTTYYEHDEIGNITGVFQNYDAGMVIDSILIHQIPEPMTLSLLAIGGLALLRRRR